MAALTAAPDLYGRPFRCVRCAQQRIAPTVTGPLPSVCDTCDPDAAIRRETHRNRTSTSERYKRRITDLETQVAQLTQALEFNKRADEAAGELGPPSRELIGRLVRRLARAEGKKDTARVLLELAGACRAWAQMLVHNGPDEGRS